MSRTIEDIEKDIEYNAKKRDEYIILADKNDEGKGVIHSMQALKYQERIDTLVEEKRVMRNA